MTVGAAQIVTRPVVGIELGGQQRIELEMAHDGDGQREQIDEVVTASTASTSSSSRMATVSRRASARPIIKAEKRSHDLGGNIGGGTVKVHTLTVQHGPQRRQAVGVQIVRADPDAFA